MRVKISTTIFLAIILAVSTLFLSGCGAPDGNAEEGARWYTMHNCFSCHGTTGSNGRAAAIAPPEMSFRSFVNYLREPDVPSMPKFPEEKISKQDAADIYVWLESEPKE